MKPRVLATQCLSYVHLQAWVPDWVSSLSSISSKNVWLCVIMVQICSWAFESIQYTQPKPEKGFVGLGIPKSGSSSWFPNKNMAFFGVPISGQSCFWGFSPDAMDIPNLYQQTMEPIHQGLHTSHGLKMAYHTTNQENFIASLCGLYPLE